MKTLMSVFALASIAMMGTASANEASVFTGKYQAVYGYCQSYPRVYISVGPSSAGPKGVFALNIQYYGQDAQMDEVLLGAGKRQAPGTSITIHGEVSEEWSTRITGTSLISETRVSRPSIGLRYQTRTLISLQGNAMTISKSTISNDGKTQTSICNLVRN